MKMKDQGIKPFLDDNFLLENTTAEILYHEYASRQPIIDYHNFCCFSQLEDYKYQP